MKFKMAGFLLGFLMLGQSLLLKAEESLVEKLAHKSWAVRKAAYKKAEKLELSDLKILIETLKKSNDPELTETAKSLNEIWEAKESAVKYKIISLKSYKSIDQVIKNYHVSKEMLLDLNGAKTLKELFAMGRIKIPAEKKLIPLAGVKLMDVLIVEDDTLESLANDFNTSRELIIRVNDNIKENKDLKAGMVIKIPRL